MIMTNNEHSDQVTMILILTDISDNEHCDKVTIIMSDNEHCDKVTMMTDTSDSDNEHLQLHTMFRSL